MPARNKIVVPQFKPQLPEIISATRINSGMISDIDPADIPNEALTIAQNVRVRLDTTQRRPGYSLFTPSQPDSNKMMLLTTFKHYDGTSDVLRFTPSTVYKRGAGVWTLWTTGTALTGGVDDHFQAVVVLNSLAFTNAKDRIYQVNSGAGTYDPIAAAPKAKFITGFFNRLVAANYLVDGAVPANGAMIGWSADANITIWDPAVDPSAGLGPLVESPSDLGDPISGIFGGTALMSILREQSVWIATKNPSASNPFNFICAVPGIGCNAPQSAAVIPSGLCWYDAHTSALWAWTPGSAPEQISYGKNEREIARHVDDPNLLFSSYSPSDAKYFMGVPVPSSSFVRVWIYDFKTKSMSYDEFPIVGADSVCNIFDIDYGPPTLTYDDLLGTYDALVGTFDSLVNVGIPRTSHIVGITNGALIEEDQSSDIDYSVNYTCVEESKDYSVPDDDINVARIKIGYRVNKPGTITLKYSIDGGVTYHTAKTVTTQITKIAYLTWNRSIKGKMFRWRLESTTGLFDLLSQEVSIYPSGKTRQDAK